MLTKEDVAALMDGMAPAVRDFVSSEVGALRLEVASLREQINASATKDNNDGGPALAAALTRKFLEAAVRV